MKSHATHTDAYGWLLLMARSTGDHNHGQNANDYINPDVNLSVTLGSNICALANC